MAEEAIARILVAGVGLRGSGYPNAINTLRMMHHTQQIDVIECGSWLPEDTHLWKITKDPPHRSFAFLVRLLSANAFSAIRLLLESRTGDVAYIPYPSIFLLWLLSWLPRRWRPRCVCDAYITLWDSLFQDRGMGAAGGWLSRLLLRAEIRALGAATHVIVDTQANARHIHRLFGVPLERIHAFPLALDEALLPGRDSGRCGGHGIRVVFIGTFVPLQGTTTIAQAIDKLRGQDSLEFTLIGDGQQADEASRWLQDNPAVSWLRGWQPADVIAAHLAGADICLGVFGGDGKAARVLPFKLYMAMAAGKAIITQHAYSTPGGCPPIPAMTCDATPDALTEAITLLARDPERRIRLERQSRDYFERYLSTTALAAHWERLLAGPGRQSGDSR